MSRTFKNWVWVVLVVWGVILCALAEARAEDKPDAVTISAADNQVILAAWDKKQADIHTAQKSMADYDAVRDKMNVKYKMAPGTEYSVGLAECVKIAGGDLKCKRSVTPVAPKPKSNVPEPTPAAPVDKK